MKALLAGACLLWQSPVAAEEWTSPYTITRQGLPTLRLENTVSAERVQLDEEPDSSEPTSL